MPLSLQYFEFLLILHLISPTFYNAQRKHLAAQLRLHMPDESNSAIVLRTTVAVDSWLSGTQRAGKNLKQSVATVSATLLMVCCSLSFLVQYWRFFAFERYMRMATRARIEVGKKNNTRLRLLLLLCSSKHPSQQQILKKKSGRWNRRFAVLKAYLTTTISSCCEGITQSRLLFKRRGASS